MTEIATLVCSICGEQSTEICVYCTKDTCSNHRCVRCRRCSDCCECEFPMTAETIPPTQPEPLPPTQPEPLPQPSPGPLPDTNPEPIPPTVPEPVPGTDPQPETPAPTFSADDLVRSLPELFAPETHPAVSEATEKPDEHHEDEPETL